MFSCIIYISNEYFDILLIKLLFIFILRNILNEVTAITQKIGLQFLFQKSILFAKNLLLVLFIEYYLEKSLKS